jgi:serine protease SohB
MVHQYGFASSQLERITRKGIPLTVCVDRVAASGGYMMAAVADKIIAAPFAVLGSIGVIAQVPNFSKVLKKNDIDFEVHTAGEYKRTLTMFGENTDKARDKFREDLAEVHVMFKGFIEDHRPSVDVEKVANGDVWYGQKAIQVNLVDELKTSDEYLQEKTLTSDVYLVIQEKKKTLPQKLGMAAQASMAKGIESAIEKISHQKWFY